MDIFKLHDATEDWNSAVSFNSVDPLDFKV